MFGLTEPTAPPILLQHANADEVLPYSQGVALYREWCALGVDARFRDLPLDHIGGGFAAVQPAVDRAPGGDVVRAAARPFTARRFWILCAPRGVSRTPASASGLRDFILWADVEHQARI